MNNDIILLLRLCKNAAIWLQVITKKKIFQLFQFSTIKIKFYLAISFPNSIYRNSVSANIYIYVCNMYISSYRKREDISAFFGEV